ncbi:hypothetical protein QE152_g3519 [Popillia japonica]|uniref:Uncharacterized protein n=1 Tax=Popillia japonica TaxID=7064 RepID=A0AAW1N3H4_POPJA
MLSLLKVTCNHVYLAISIAAWTIIQSFVHIYGLMHIQWWRDCKIHGEPQKFVHIYGLMHIQWWRDCKIHGEPQKHYLTILFGKQVCNNTENNILE